MRARNAAGAKSSVWLAGLLISSLLLLRTIFLARVTVIIADEQTSIDFIVDDTLHGNADSGQIVTSNTERSNQSNGSFVFPRICLDEPLYAPIWEWHFFTKNTSADTGAFQSQKKVLIATYSAFGTYARLLELTSPINKAYARRWTHDMVVLQGTSFILPWDKNCTPPEERSRFNKIDLLREALLRKNEYDHLLLLDADTLIYDFSFDISRLVPSNETMLVAQRTHQEDPTATRNINNGITLWNLHHPLTRQVADDWDQACRDGIPDNRPYRGDQFYLRQVLKSEDRVAAISSVWDEFYYRDGTVVKHFQRSNSRSWNETGLDTREDRILNATKDISQRFDIDEQQLDRKNYSAITGSTEIDSPRCTTRRKSKWDHHRFLAENSVPLTSKRLLIAQYSSFGSYASLLEVTAPINKAYARKWGVDVLIVQGNALLFKNDRPDCELPSHRAMYNKIPLLIHALSKRDEYDQVLILDADAMIYDFAFDITQLLTNKDMLTAQKVNPDGNAQTWNVNIGISLWNLHHNKTHQVAKRWLKRTSQGLDKAFESKGVEHGDQHYLQMVLKRDISALKAINATSNAFQYENGTVIKHFVRPKHSDWSGNGMTNREVLIARTATEVCNRFPSDCEDLEYLPYATL